MSTSAIRKSGISGFETVEQTRRRQDDVLQRLQNSPLLPRHYAGLMKCGVHKCGRDECTEACWFGNRRQRLHDIPLVYRLLRCSPGPWYEVRVVRAVWARPFGQLHEASIAAANKLNRRALDKLYRPAVVAVGTFKAAVGPNPMGQEWICEIHQIVAAAGASKQALEQVFTSCRFHPGTETVWVKEINDLGPAITRVLTRDLAGWQHPYQIQTPYRAKKAQRTELYEWLLGLEPGALIMRYGCDRYFNRLAKQPRPLFQKRIKRRPYPYWLAPYMFGQRVREY